MSTKLDDSGPSRRGFLSRASGLLIASGAPALGVVSGASVTAARAETAIANQADPFFGPHQGGILTPAQRHTYFAAFDLVATQRADIVRMLRSWTEAAARLCAGQPAGPAPHHTDILGTDAGDVQDLAPARLTITFGFGPGLFTKDGVDRYGLAARRSAALVDLPHFPGDQLVAEKSDGDLSVQACADDPQVAFHAVRELARLAYDAAQIRWVQAGFCGPGGKATPRNLMGFKDGTNNPSTTDAAAMNQVVWVGQEGPRWMAGGSYLVVRRSRIALEHWDRMKIAFQEQTVGRQKHSGAPLGGHHEHDQPNLDLNDADGNPVTPENAHVRLAAAATNDGARILRRAYSYNDGANLTAERWPPWRQGMEFDAGLLFICYQKDPRTGFIKIFERMAKFDMLNQFVTVTGSALFACPGGVAKGRYIGQDLFEEGAA
jgi:deferrochelatase/peroxidase EfeB